MDKIRIVGKLIRRDLPNGQIQTFKTDSIGEIELPPVSYSAYNKAVQVLSQKTMLIKVDVEWLRQLAKCECGKCPIIGLDNFAYIFPTQEKVEESGCQNTVGKMVENAVKYGIGCQTVSIEEFFKGAQSKGCSKMDCKYYAGCGCVKCTYEPKEEPKTMRNLSGEREQVDFKGMKFEDLKIYPQRTNNNTPLIESQIELIKLVISEPYNKLVDLVETLYKQVNEDKTTPGA